MDNDSFITNMLKGLLGFALIGFLVWILSPNIPDEDIKQAHECQRQAISLGLVTIDKKKGVYIYSRNKYEQLMYFKHMYQCLPKSHRSQRTDIKNSIEKLEKELGW